MNNDQIMWGPDSSASFSAHDPDHVLRNELRFCTTEELIAMGTDNKVGLRQLQLAAEEVLRRERTATLLPSELRPLYNAHNPFAEQSTMERLEYLTIVIERRENSNPNAPDIYAAWPVPPHEMLTHDLKYAQALKFTRAELALAGLRNQLEVEAILQQSEQRERDNLFGASYTAETDEQD